MVKNEADDDFFDTLYTLVEYAFITDPETFIKTGSDGGYLCLDSAPEVSLESKRSKVPPTVAIRAHYTLKYYSGCSDHPAHQPVSHVYLARFLKDSREIEVKLEEDTTPGHFPWNGM